MNINDHVKVVLTVYGAAVYNDYYTQFTIDIRPPLKQEGDTLKDSVWHVMHVFGGEKIGMGMRSPFKECQMEIC